MKVLRLLALVAVVFFVMVVPAFAQTTTTPSTVNFAGAGLGVGIGAALTIVGAGYGFGKIGAAALESMARQPEVAGRVQTGMLIIAALLEGATFFSLIVCILLMGKANF